MEKVEVAVAALVRYLMRRKEKGPQEKYGRPLTTAQMVGCRGGAQLARIDGRFVVVLLTGVSHLQ